MLGTTSQQFGGIGEKRLQYNLFFPGLCIPADCNNNGQCQEGECICSDGWKGSACNEGKLPRGIKLF